MRILSLIMHLTSKQYLSSDMIVKPAWIIGQRVLDALQKIK